MAVVTSKTARILTSNEVVAALFDLIAEHGLVKARLTMLAPRLDVTVADLHKQFGTIAAVLDAFMDGLDQQAVALSGNLANLDKRDRYFDLLMGRFDALQRHRAGVLRWLGDLAKQPSLWRPTLRRWDDSLSLLLDLAGDSPLLPIKKIGLGLVYAATLQAWRKDDTADLAQTMAALDRALGHAHDFASRYLTHRKPV